MSLEKYKAKRKFNETPEPKGKKRQKVRQRFVVQKHQATNRHYDFRLELDGVLKSWAIPKTPPKVKGIRRLAMQVEDHPVDYIGFEGVIPKGNYGAGEVEIWDKGSFKTIIRKTSGLKIELDGKLLKGTYVLVKPKGSTFSKNAWLFFKV